VLTPPPDATPLASSAPTGEETSSPAAELSPPPIWARIPTPAYAAFGIGAAFIVVGITAGIEGDEKHSTLAAECMPNGSCPSSAQSDIDGFHSQRSISTIGYVIGGLGVASGAAMCLWLTPDSAHGGGSVRVSFGPGSARLQVDY
jgi:hypothetical protein